ncbi:hypothetical protein GCM10009863_08530 [Streptomyces axinellae]|uniref:Uncharacterized protein n=1 Tax=Streptomyces axinellae TaxID=552788 RepID=A0ABN3PQB9_9ACTN
MAALEEDRPSDWPSDCGTGLGEAAQGDGRNPAGGARVVVGPGASAGLSATMDE